MFLGTSAKKPANLPLTGSHYFPKKQNRLYRCSIPTLIRLCKSGALGSSAIAKGGKLVHHAESLAGTDGHT